MTQRLVCWLELGLSNSISCHGRLLPRIKLTALAFPDANPQTHRREISRAIAPHLQGPLTKKYGIYASYGIPNLNPGKL